MCVICVTLQDGHTTVSWYQLSHWEDCPKWDNFNPSNYTAGGTTISFDEPCEYFTVGECAAQHVMHQCLKLPPVLCISVLEAKAYSSYFYWQ